MTDKNTFFLRAHHGMCFHYYIGIGYSSDFTENMSSVLKYLLENDPVVTIVEHGDHVCAKCPNYKDGSCTNTVEVPHYDRSALEFTGLEPNTEMRFLEYARIVREEILSQGLREKICGGCRWTKLCTVPGKLERSQAKNGCS